MQRNLELYVHILEDYYFILNFCFTFLENRAFCCTVCVIWHVLLK